MLAERLAKKLEDHGKNKSCCGLRLFLPPSPRELTTGDSHYFNHSRMRLAYRLAGLLIVGMNCQTGDRTTPLIISHKFFNPLCIRSATIVDLLEYLFEIKNLYFSLKVPKARTMQHLVILQDKMIFF